MVKNKMHKGAISSVANKAPSQSMPQQQDSESEENSDYEEASGDSGFKDIPSMKKVDTMPQKRKMFTDNVQTHKKKSKKSEEIVKPPTLEEMKELRDTLNLFHSNLLKLQVKEMLQELQLKTKYSSYIETWIESFTTFVQQLDDEMLEQNSRFEVPLNLSGLQLKKPLNFSFLKPTTPPQLIGGALTKTLLGPQLIVDVAVEMPAACFQKEDYLNLMYDQKRALYLCHLTQQMRTAAAYKKDDFAYNYHANNPLKPVLQLSPAGKIGRKLQLRLYITAPQVFKLSRFVPWNNNLRPNIFGDEWNQEQVAPATQHYNANVLFDLTMMPNQSLLNKVFVGRRNFQEGLLLLKVWLRQRQLDVGYTGFGSHILASYIVYLNQQRLLHQSSSSYQVARTVWNQLANSDWTLGITLAPVQSPELTTLTAYYDVCFMDVTGYFNLAANVPLAVYQRVCAEAKLAVDLLNDMKINSFPILFMQKCPLYSRMDNILKIAKPSSVDQLLQLHVQPHVRYDYANYAYPQLLKLLTELLNKGLSKRVKAILPLESATESWSLDAKAPTIGRSLHLGIILDPEHAYEVLDKGPEAIAPDAEDFRKFWGDKANLRRFQDGSITEAVVWGASTDAPSKKRLVVRQIVLHLLEHHLQLEPTDVHYIGAELDVVYTLTPAFKINRVQTKLPLQQDTDAEVLASHVIHCYDELARQLHGLVELPLEIVSISGTSPVFRYCEPQPVLPQARLIEDKLYATQVQRVIIQLGQSGKWPNELGALRALKTAFYIKIGDLLQSKHRLHTKLTYGGLLVLKRGYCFQLELAHNKELALLKKEVTERNITRYVDSPKSRELERSYYILPKVSGALHALAQTHSAFGPTVLIAKRWLGSQLLDDGLWPNMATELLVAHLFLEHHAPHQTASPQTGFFRLLQLLAQCDWKSELFLLNFNNSWDETQITNLEQSFRSTRSNYSPLCLATAYDKQHAGQLWTSAACPNVQVLARVTLLARHALQFIESNLLSNSLSFLNRSQLFRASNEGYDLIIQLKPDLVSNTLCYDFGSSFVQLSSPNFRLPLAGSDNLAHIVAQLRSAYSDFAAFFYNPYGGKELAIIWKPEEIFAPKPFKVTEVQACTPCAGGKVQVRKETLLADFKFLLKDYYLRFCTLDELKRELRQPVKRYFNRKQSETSPDMPKKKINNNLKAPKNEETEMAEPKKKRNNGSAMLKKKQQSNSSTTKQINLTAAEKKNKKHGTLTAGKNGARKLLKGKKLKSLG